jgi:hypothetical protein
MVGPSPVILSKYRGRCCTEGVEHVRKRVGVSVTLDLAG